jgi:hypothetical protein
MLSHKIFTLPENKIKINECVQKISNVQELIFCINEAFIPFWKNDNLDWEEMKMKNKNRGLLLNLIQENEELNMSKDFEALLKSYAICFCDIYSSKL